MRSKQKRTAAEAKVVTPSYSQEELRHFAEFFEHSEMLLSIYDKNLNMVEANEALLRTLHFERADIIGKNISEISPDCKSSGRYRQYEEVIKTGQTLITDQMRLHPSLGSHYMRVTAFKLGDGMGISSKDITDLRETIEELETFIYRTAHDIRAPICTALGLINVAVKETEDREAMTSYLGLLRQETTKLDQIVKRLHETSRIRQGQKSLYAIDFGELVDDVIHSFSTMEEFPRIRFRKHIQVQSRLFYDKVLLRTIFQNLIHNSVKYRNGNHRASYITISVADDRTGVMIRIEDNGMGIPEKLQKDVFKMFFRGTERAGGSGLGLYTVKHCVKKLGGHITMESMEEQGTTFMIFVPGMKS
jgi:PAS domain S-box-containing protein